MRSALSGPALAGISVTERGSSAGVTVISGHRVGNADYDWAALGRSKLTSMARL